MRRGFVAFVVVAMVGGLGPAVMPQGSGVAVAAGSSVLPFDFDGDGYVDLAVGVPGEDLRGVSDAGAVQVLYGSATGVTARDQLWHQGVQGVKGALEKGDRFGSAVASGDFDGDGFADLAIGTSGEDVGGIVNAGAVQVLYGSASGLTARDQVWHQGTTGVPGRNERDDQFGYRLAAGDFDGDGFADLVVGSPFEAAGTLTQSGWVVVLRGGPTGLTSSGAQSWRQGLGGLPSQPAAWERFGYRLATGDVDGDGRDELAIGVTESDGAESLDDRNTAIHLLSGSPGGLTAAGSQYIRAEDLGDLLGTTLDTALTFGDFDRDGRADLALGADDFAAVLHGHADGLHPAVLPAAADVAPGVDALWSAIGHGDEDVASVVAAGDLTGDGYPDLAGPGPNRGVPTVLILGTATGLGPVAREWSAPAVTEWGLHRILSLSGQGHAWLVVRLPDEAEAVAVLRGTSTGDAGPVTVWSQNSPGIKGATEPGDGFGAAIGG